MPRVRLLALLSSVLFLANFSQAQTATGETLMLDLPRQSQHAVVTQRIGITDITVNYHRPLANGRQIWGKLAPYGQVWRAGANENTTITFSDPVTVEGQALDKGTYGLHMIPGENQWTVIFSKNSKDWGSFTYKQEDDALRVNVKPQTAEGHDALAYDFDDLKADSAVVTMRWDKVAVHGHDRGIRLQVIEIISQRIVALSRLRLHVDAQRVILLLVGKASPVLRILGEDHSPLILAGDHVQPIRPLVERLTFNGDRIAKRDGRILVRARAPHLPVRRKLAPDLASIGQRPVIVNGNVGDANALRHHRMLALPRQIEHQGFARSGLSLAKV